MKKALTLIIAFIAIASQAASIDWTMTFGPMTIKNSSGGNLEGAAYLIMSSDLTTLEESISADVSTFTTELTNLALETISISGGVASQLSKTTTHDRLDVDSQYTFAFLIFDSANDEYYLSDTKSQKAYDESVENPVKRKISFTSTNLGATAIGVASKQTFSPAVIPEPATGALALAGLALLFRRKRV